MNSLASEGEELTSKRTHFKEESMIMSYPNISKQFGLFGMSAWQARMLFTTIS